MDIRTGGFFSFFVNTECVHWSALLGGFGGLEKGQSWFLFWSCFLTSESVEGTSLAFQSIDNIHGSDGLSLGVLSVGDSIPDDVFQENLEDSSGFFIDQSRDSLHSTTTSKTTDGGLGDTLDVIPQHLPVPLGTSFSKSFSSLTTAWHVYCSNSASRMASACASAPYIRQRRQTKGALNIGPQRHAKIENIGFYWSQENKNWHKGRSIY